MLCARCGLTNAPGAVTCPRCGGALPATRATLAKPAVGSKLDTSWLPATNSKAGLTAAASGLRPHHTATSIWQVQGNTDSVRTIRGAQAAAALMLPGALMALIYGVYQIVWRRGIFSTIASDPIGVGEFTARRSDNLNVVLLGVTIALMVVACGGAAWWIAHNKLLRSVIAPIGFVIFGLLLTLAAAIMCRFDSPSVIAIAYVMGGIGCFALAGGVGTIIGRAVQAVTGDTSWVRVKRAPLPRRNASGPGLAPDAVGLLAKSSLSGTGSGSVSSGVPDLRRSGLVPVTKPVVKADWSALKESN